MNNMFLMGMLQEYLPDWMWAKLQDEERLARCVEDNFHAGMDVSSTIICEPQASELPGNWTDYMLMYLAQGGWKIKLRRLTLQELLLVFSQTMFANSPWAENIKDFQRLEYSDANHKVVAPPVGWVYLIKKGGFELTVPFSIGVGLYPGLSPMDMPRLQVDYTTMMRRWRDNFRLAYEIPWTGGMGVKYYLDMKTGRRKPLEPPSLTMVLHTLVEDYDFLINEPESLGQMTAEEKLAVMERGTAAQYLLEQVKRKYLGD